MKREIMIAKQFLTIAMEEKPYIGAFAEKATREIFCRKHPLFAYHTGRGIQKTAFIFENFDFVLKWYRMKDFWVEKEVFYKAQEAKVEKWFLPISVFFFEGYCFAVQKKILIREDYLQSNAAKKEKPYWSDEDYFWVYPHYRDYYKAVFPKQLVAFLADNCIVDIHSHNWGYTKTGHPALIDYAL